MGQKVDKLRINSRKVGCLEQHIYFWEKIFFKFVNLFLVVNFSTPSGGGPNEGCGFFLKIPPGVLPMYVAHEDRVFWSLQLFSKILLIKPNIMY